MALNSTSMAGSMSDRFAVVFAFGLLLSSLFSIAAHAGQMTWRVETLKLPSSAVRLFTTMKRGSGFSRIRIKTRNSGWFTLGKCAGKPCATALETGYATPPLPFQALPDSEVTRGKRNIRAAWLAGPTRRYAHGVLGDAIEASRVVVEDRRGKLHSLTLTKIAVFEDRYARLADIDGDGSDEIIVVKSYLNQGAALAVLFLTQDGLRIGDETPAIGRAHRWLNPAGIADYDGDKNNELAIVVTPHIGGRLEFWGYRNGKLHRKAHLNGFSNHVIGSQAQQMSASADFDGDGITDLALPTQDRKAIRFISISGGTARVFAHVKLPGAVVTEIILVQRPETKRPELVMGLDTGQLAFMR